MSAATHPIPVLDRKGLREFGLVTGAIVAALFGLFFPWALNVGYPLWPWIFFAVFAVWGLVAPNTLGPVYRIWMRFGLLLSKFTTPLIMGAVFFLVFAPVALVLRLAKWDPMNRRLDDEAESYRVVRSPPTKPNLERPF